MNYYSHFWPVASRFETNVDATPGQKLQQNLANLIHSANQGASAILLEEPDSFATFESFIFEVTRWLFFYSRTTPNLLWSIAGLLLG